MSENLRTFFAVTLSKEAREAAAQLAGRLRGSERGEGDCRGGRVGVAGFHLGSPFPRESGAWSS